MYTRKNELVRQAREVLAEAGYQISARRINRAFTFSSRPGDESGSHSLWGALQKADPIILVKRLQERGVVFRAGMAVGRKHANNSVRGWRGGRKGIEGVKLSPPKTGPTVPVEAPVEIKDGNICPNPRCGYHDPSSEAVKCPSCGAWY